MATNSRKCKECNQVFEKQRPLQYLCSVSCSIEYGKKERLKKVNSDWKAEKKVLIEKLKTLEDWKADLQVIINSIVRLIDFGQPCIATGATTGKRNAGHRISVGANRTTRFHLHNIHIQSEHSNSWKGGDNIRYDEGLERIYGKDYLEYVRSLNQIKTLHLTIEDIKQAIKLAKVVEKDLKLKGMVYNVDERMTLRTIYNNFIGIYK